MVKNLPAMREPWVQCLGWEDLLEKGMATHSMFLPGKSQGSRSLVGYNSWGPQGSDSTEQLTVSLSKSIKVLNKYIKEEHKHSL